MRRACFAWLVLAAAALAACGSEKSPTTPAVGTAAAAEGIAVTPSDRLGWTQPVATADEAASFKYRLSIDGTLVDLRDVTCLPGDASGTFCSAPLPPLSPGRHVLSLVAVNADGVEGPPSAALPVIAG